MLCFQVKINDEECHVYGEKDLEQFRVNFVGMPWSSKVKMSLSGVFKNNGKSVSIDYCLLDKKVGDTISIEIVEGSPDVLLSPSEEELLDYCSFCGKNEKEVLQLVRGPYGNICDQCVKDSSEIISRGE